MTPISLFTQLYVERKEVVLHPLTAKQAAAIRQSVYRQRKSAADLQIISSDTASLPLICRPSDTEANAFRLYVAAKPVLSFTLC